MQTISNDEFKKKYGTSGVALMGGDPKKPAQGSGFIDRLKKSAGQGIDQIKAGAKEVSGNKAGSLNPLPVLEGALKVGAGAVNTAFSPVTAAIEPVTKPTIGAAVNYAADKISNVPAVQKFADSKAGRVTSRVVENVDNLNTIASAIVGSKAVGKVASKISGAVDSAVEGATGSLSKLSPKLAKSGEAIPNAVKNGIRDVSPTYNSVINDQVAKAFELTPGDIKNIKDSTGHNVGDFVASHNLIGDTVEQSHKMLDDFYQSNYKAVRSEIDKVPTTYSQSSVPRYTEALTELQKQITEVPGLQSSSAEVNSLLNKKTITLGDVQRVKELMDDHFNLYKITGDVKEGIAKKGLSNIRSDLRSFIEDQVKQNGGNDISELNNNVSASRGIMKAIEDRAGRANTRNKISLSDLGWFSGGSVIGTPLLGGALLFAKKVLESPSMRLKIAKFVHGLSEAKQAKIQFELQAGRVPPEINNISKNAK